MGLELLHVNRNSSYQICALFQLDFRCPGILILFLISFCFILFFYLLNVLFCLWEESLPRLCDSAIWIERTSDFMLGCYYYYYYYIIINFLHRLNKFSLYFKNTAASLFCVLKLNLLSLADFWVTHESGYAYIYITKCYTSWIWSWYIVFVYNMW